jgi:nitrogenase molybdenum-iron protein alpha chain
MKEELGINVLAFSCEGYKGVSQSAGHHIANNGVFKHMIGLDDTPDRRVHHEHPRRIQHRRRRLGNRRPAPEMRHHVTATLSGNVSYDQIKRCHTAT